MSGSYDRRSGRGPQGGPPSPTYDPYEDVITGPPTAQPTHGQPYTLEANPTIAPPPRPPEPQMYAPAREGRPQRMRTHAPVVPAGSVTGKSLTLVISIMCFLACLTAGAVYMIKRSADAWLQDIASEVTVQVMPRNDTDNAGMDKITQNVSTYLANKPGITDARTLSLEDSSKLLEPWLGQSGALGELPVPRLIALQLDRTAPPDFETLRQDLNANFQGVILDDHRHWQRQIRTVTRSFALGGIAILLLVAAATIAIIVSATRSAMASNKDIVEVLHFVGATDGFIAREFEKHFLALGIRAGLVGALLAMAVFFVMPTAMQLLGGGTVTLNELQRLIGTGALDLAGYVLLAIVVVVIAAICMLTSRFGVFRILNSQH